MMNPETALKPSPRPPPPNEAQPPIKGAKSRSLWILWLVILCVLSGIGALVVYRQHTSQANASSRNNVSARGIPIDVATAQRGNLPVYQDGLLGTVTPIQTVTIHTRVDGQLIKVAFVEGQIVKKGDLLVQIDPNPFKAQLLQAQGQLAKDQASLKDAQLDLTRYRQAPDAYTAQQIDAQQALVDQDAGAVKSDQGTIDSAQVQLDYCTITAPVTGLVGLRLVDEGNIVHASDATGLVVITQLQPITVIFPIEQEYISDVLTRSGRVPPLEATALDDDREIAKGKLAAVDSQVDTTTGTVKLRAQFDNEKLELFPNQLLTVRLLVNTLKHVVLIPTEGVQTGPDSSFVDVVKSDNTVEVRTIKPGHSEIVDGQDMTVIDEGLSAGETVVTNGVDKLQAGSKVDPTRGGTTRPTTRSGTTRPGTTRPGGHVRRSLTNDSDQPATPPRNGE